MNVHKNKNLKTKTNLLLLLLDSDLLFPLLLPLGRLDHSLVLLPMLQRLLLRLGGQIARPILEDEHRVGLKIRDRARCGHGATGREKAFRVRIGLIGSNTLWVYEIDTQKNGIYSHKLCVFF